MADPTLTAAALETLLSNGHLVETGQSWSFETGASDALAPDSPTREGIAIDPALLVSSIGSTSSNAPRAASISPIPPTMPSVLAPATSSSTPHTMTPPVTYSAHGTPSSLPKQQLSIPSRSSPAVTMSRKSASPSAVQSSQPTGSTGRSATPDSRTLESQYGDQPLPIDRAPPMSPSQLDNDPRWTSVFPGPRSVCTLGTMSGA